ncbi:MAG: hypothetical protein ACK46L_05250 [Synechococcaceae cyanobacterium]
MSRTGTPEAHALLPGAGVAPKPAPRQHLGADDQRFSLIASEGLSGRLVEVEALPGAAQGQQKSCMRCYGQRNSTTPHSPPSLLLERDIRVFRKD